MKKILSILTVVCLLFCFVGCFQENETTITSIPSSENSSEIINETSSNNKTSSKATVQKPTHQHQFSNATCTSPRKCTSCGITEGTALGHSFSNATCTNPKKCSVCGKTEGNSLGHSFSNATCTTAKKCTICGVSEGSALGHNYSEGKCSVCGDIDANYVKPIEYSRVSGEFTYKYNNFVGNRGDDGTKVLFVPKNTELKTKDNKSAMMLGSSERKYDSGIILEVCDGYGEFDTGLEHIPAGEYIVIVVSKNTRNSGQMTKDTLSTYLGDYISDADLETLALFIGFNKCAIDNMELKAGYEHTISNHFGVTYF